MIEDDESLKEQGWGFDKFVDRAEYVIKYNATHDPHMGSSCKTAAIANYLLIMYLDCTYPEILTEAMDAIKRVQGKFTA